MATQMRMRGSCLQVAILQTRSTFPISNVYYYINFCKEDGIYTLHSFDLYGDDWQKNQGYTMTMDVDELKDGSLKPLSVTTVFSTFIPFQIEYTDWKEYQGVVSDDWNTISYDDSA